MDSLLNFFDSPPGALGWFWADEALGSDAPSLIEDLEITEVPEEKVRDFEASVTTGSWLVVYG